MKHTTYSFGLMRTTPRIFLAAWAAAILNFSAIPGRAASLDLLASFEAISYNGWTPCDPVIAAGPSSLVTMVSERIAIFNKQGTKLFEQNLGAGGFWAAQGGDQVAEPWVIFDPNSGRFIASAADFGGAKGVWYLAISKNSNPLTSADWHKYSLDRTGTHQGPNFPEVLTYPDNAKVGVDGDAIYVTSGHFAKDQSITGNFSHAELFALDKAPLLTGGPLQILHDEPVITDPQLIPGHPAIVFEPAPAMYFVQATARQPDDTIVVHSLTDIFTTPTQTTSPVMVADYDRPPNVPQRGSSILLENIDARLMSVVVRNGALWTSHAVKDPADGESVVRWYQFAVSGLPLTGATLMQSGEVDPGPGIHTWLPHIGVDGDGNMGLSFSVGGVNQYAAIGYTGRLANDPAGTTYPVQTARAGAGSYTLGGWGEYSGLAIDPDDQTFWLFHEYPTKQKTWNTFVGAFQVIPPALPSDPLHCGDLDGSSATAGKYWKTTVVVTVHDGNHAPVPGATVSVQWIVGASGSSSAVTDANGRCTFISGNISKLSPNATLTITGVTKATLTYSAAANHDPDGDSNGTSITVNKP